MITKHAMERLEERFNCRKDKIQKICIKAWRSKTPPDKVSVYYKKKNPNNKGKIFRAFNGLVFIFRYKHNKDLNLTQKVLITVYNPKLYEPYESKAK